MIDGLALPEHSLMAVYAVVIFFMMTSGVVHAAVDSYYEMCDASAAVAVDEIRRNYQVGIRLENGKRRVIDSGVR
jgi:hypothetical protein